MQQSLQTKHEELLALDEDNHPPYINSNYLKAYKALFKSHGFCCRFKSCPASDTGFPSTKARASHETDHFPIYRCKECDFSVRGFRSKGDLVNHVNKYHANTENIELPAELLPSTLITPQQQLLQLEQKNKKLMMLARDNILGQPQAQGQPPPLGTLGQRSDMPPPQAPATGSTNANHTQPRDPNFPDQPINTDFSGLETADVLNDFDFDKFLNTDDGSNWQLGADLSDRRY